MTGQGGVQAADVVRVAARLQRVVAAAERAAFAAVAAVGSAWLAARVLASELRSRGRDPDRGSPGRVQVTLPELLEWDAESHDRGEPTESSDYVDGWNDAVSAARAMNPGKR